MQLAAFLSHLLLFLSPLSKDEQEDETCVNKTKRPYTILVEGNVGSGKSTMLQFFAQEAPGGCKFNVAQLSNSIRLLIQWALLIVTIRLYSHNGDFSSYMLSIEFY